MTEISCCAASFVTLLFDDSRFCASSADSTSVFSEGVGIDELCPGDLLQPQANALVVKTVNKPKITKALIKCRDIEVRQ